MSVYKPSSDLSDFVKFSITKYKGVIFFIPILMLTLIIFESYQQYYYIIRFNLSPAEELSMITFFIAHSYRWLIWMMSLSTYIAYLLEKGRIESLFDLKKWPVSISHLMVLLTFNLSVISIIQIQVNDLPFTINTLREHVVFYFFQKTPLFILAHSAIVGIMYLLHTNQSMSIKLLTLEKHSKIDHTYSEENPAFNALSISVGKRDKIIQFKEIIWIEAYDYCVKIHTDRFQVYAMRNSLKALEVSLRSVHFLRVHRKSLVNMKKVLEFHYENSILLLEGGLEIEVAKTRRTEVRKFLQAKPSIA